MARNLEKYFKKSEKISGEIKFVPEMTKKPSDPKSAVSISFLSYSYFKLIRPTLEVAPFQRKVFQKLFGSPFSLF